MYRCSECERMVDNDYHPCTEDTRKGPMSGDLLCPACADIVEETKEVRQGGVFTPEQLATIKKLEGMA